MATSNPSRSESTSSPRANNGASFLRLFNIVLLVLLIIATSVGATLYYASKESGFSFLGATAQANTEAATAANENSLSTTSIKPIFTSLDPFTVTLSDGIRSRILHVAITLRVEDDDSRRLLNEFMPMVRDRILKTLSAQDPFHVQTPEGRDELVISLTGALRQPFNPNPTAPRVADVLFTAFVVQ